jgi:hypothetical protein
MPEHMNLCASLCKLLAETSFETDRKLLLKFGDEASVPGKRQKYRLYSAIEFAGRYMERAHQFDDGANA